MARLSGRDLAGDGRRGGSGACSGGSSAGDEDDPRRRRRGGAIVPPVPARHRGGRGDTKFPCRRPGAKVEPPGRSASAAPRPPSHCTHGGRRHRSRPRWRHRDLERVPGRSRRGRSRRARRTGRPPSPVNAPGYRSGADQSKRARRPRVHDAGLRPTAWHDGGEPSSAPPRRAARCARQVLEQHRGPRVRDLPCRASRGSSALMGSPAGR
jgi:hypothetical protein